MNDYDYNEYLQNLGQIPIPIGMLDFSDPRYKDSQVNFQVRYMLSRTQEMFKYDGLPDSIPQRNLEMILQTCGNVCLTEVNGVPRAFFGGLGGELDEYYQPTIYTIANPYLKFDANLKIGKDCIWGRSDSYGVGLLPIFQWYASTIIETGITLRVGLINARITKTISAQDDATYKSALKYLEDVEDGKLGVISDSAFFEGLNITTTPTQTEHLTDIVEVLQYLKASWFNELGLQANYNMKRERIQNAEAENDNDALLPLIDNMLNERRKMLEAFNEKYGYNVTVKLASAWEDVQEDAENEKVEDDTINDEVNNSENNNTDTVKVESMEGADVSQSDTMENEPQDEEAPQEDVNIVVNVGDNETIVNDGEVTDVETTEDDAGVDEPDGDGDIHTDTD